MVGRYVRICKVLKSPCVYISTLSGYERVKRCRITARHGNLSPFVIFRFDRARRQPAQEVSKYHIYLISASPHCSKSTENSVQARCFHTSVCVSVNRGSAFADDRAQPLIKMLLICLLCNLLIKRSLVFCLSWNVKKPQSALQ